MRAAPRGDRRRQDDDGRRRATSCSSPTPSRPSAAAAAGAPTSWRAACARTAIASPCCGRAPARRPACRVVADAFDGFDVHELGGPSPPMPFVRNYFKNERLAARARRRSCAISSATRGIDVVHGQHLLSIPGAIAGAHAGRRAGGRHHPRLLAGLLLVGSDPRSIERRRCARRARPAMMTRCVRAHAGAGVAGGAAGDPLHARQPALEGGARWPRPTPSSRSARRWPAISSPARRRSPRRRVEVIPNPVDVATLDAPRTRRGRPRPPTSPARTRSTSASSRFNKGVQHLIPAARRGPAAVAARRRRRRARSRRARDARRAPSGLDVRFTGWLDRAGDARAPRARGAARLPVARPRVAEPRAARSERARRRRSRRWTPAARATSSSPDETGLLSTRRPGWPPTSPGSSPTRRCARGSARRRRRACATTFATRGGGRARSARSTTRCIARQAAPWLTRASAARRDPGALRPAAARRRRPRAPRLRSGAPPGAARPARSR